MKLLAHETIDTIVYELHANARVRVYDSEADETVTFVFYPTLAAARAAYNAAIVAAKK